MNTSYEYMDETPINQELICVICQTPFVDPVQTPCDKTFCRQCITTWIQTGNASCPLCQRPLSIDNLTPSTRIIRNMLNQLKVKCSFCGQINLQRGDFNDHVQRMCPQMILSCPFSNHNCSWTGSLKQLNEHLKMSHTSINLQLHHPNNAVQSEQNQKRHTPNNSSPNIATIFFGVLTILIIIYCLLRKYSSINIVIEFAHVYDNKAIIESISCANMAQNAPFQQSNLLTKEHQHCLNYFYNNTDSSIEKWILIYRGSIHGLNATSFHTHCDNKRETYIILSSNKGYLFGGYVDVNWATSTDRVPLYSSSENAFIFSLMNPRNIPAKKYSSDKQYESYAIVNDVSSGPIFHGRNLPDMDIYDLNGRFHCQIHFPSVYMLDIGVSSFPSSDDCIINEMEVFIPVFKTQPLFGSFLSFILKIALSILITVIEFLIFGFMSTEYEANRPELARITCFVALVFLRLLYMYGQLVLFQLVFILFVIGTWEQPNAINLSHIRYEKRFVMLCFILLLTCMILFC